MALSVLACSNLTRVINIVGIGPLMDGSDRGLK